MHVIQVLGFLPKDISNIRGFRKAQELLEADPNAPVVILINSGGGVTTTLRQFVEFQQRYRLPVAAAGHCSSAAFYFLAGGKKGERWIHEKTTCVIHLGQFQAPLTSAQIAEGILSISAADVDVLTRRTIEMRKWAINFWRTTLNLEMTRKEILDTYAPAADWSLTVEEVQRIQVVDHIGRPPWLDEALKIIEREEIADM